MALKFLNKKGWHTGSLRNIENVWKAEQKHEAEQKKLEELRKQIHEERERTEFRLLQEKAGLVPHQERLEFLYDSGLSVGNLGNSEGFKTLEAFPKSDAAADAPSSSASASKQEASVPGALFEDKPQSANDAWRKLHSDPLLMIRQREQEALAQIKNNPVKMAMIKKSVQETGKEKSRSKKEKRKKHRSSKSKHKNQYDSEDDMKHHSSKSKNKYQSDSEDDAKHRSSKSKHKNQSDSEDDAAKRRKRMTADGNFEKKYHRAHSDSEYDSSEEERKRKKNHFEDKRYRERSPSHHQGQRNGKGYKEDADYEDKRYRERSPGHHQGQRSGKGYKEDADYEDKRYRERSPGHPQGQRSGEGYKEDADEKHYYTSKTERYASRGHSNVDAPRRGAGTFPEEHESHYKRRNVAPKLSEEERAAKLRQMQVAAELHEGQRWKRIKKAEETDAQEATQNNNAGGKNFLDIAQKSIYGAAEGGSSSIAESVRRRTHYSQGRSAGEGNAFRR